MKVEWTQKSLNHRWFSGLHSVLLLLSTILMLPLCLFAQVSNPAMPDSSVGEKLADLRIGAYLDVYAGWFSHKGSSSQVPYFVSMNQSRQVSVNLALLDFRYQKNRIRARLMPGFGTYMNSNYSAEPGSLGYLVEANAGFCLFPEKQIWLDAGVLSSPYTNESCFSRDHLMYSRSLAPEYVPYYLSGAKLSLPLSRNLTLYLYALNGWQQIQDRNDRPALGTQLEWRGQKSLFNWNTYLGDERNGVSGLKGEKQRMRWFSDVYWVFNPDGDWSATACAFAGLQEYANGWKWSNASWWQVNGILRYRFHPDHSISARLEYFSDARAVVTEPLNPEGGFNLGSAGFCWNSSLGKNALFRVEGRQFFSKEKLFSDGNSGKAASWILSGLTLWF